MSERLLIVGASVRAAAQSAVRAGFQACAIDQFADGDLIACCPAQRAPDYPQEIIPLAAQFPPGPFMYTGALENSPEVLAALADIRPLWGNPPAAVQAVRNPWTLHDRLRRHAVATPEVLSPDQPAGSGPWMLKPQRSGAGLGIQRIDRGQESSLGQYRTSLRDSHYCQRFVAGEPISAQFVAAHGSAALLGATRQLCGCPWAGARAWWYVGNVGKLALPPTVNEKLQRIGDLLAREFSLTGLFGVDAVLDGTEVWVIEVNPRYTAALEVIERSGDQSAIRWHRDACVDQQLPDLRANPSRELQGKAVLYSRRRVRIAGKFLRWAAELNSQSTFPVVADLPVTGTTIPRGKPICTVFGAAASAEEVTDHLQAMARETFAMAELSSDPD